MRIEKLTDRIRNDFWFTGKCERCDNIETGMYGYADAHFCLEILPNQKCPQCGYTTNDCRALLDAGKDYRKDELDVVTEPATR